MLSEEKYTNIAKQLRRFKESNSKDKNELLKIISNTDIDAKQEDDPNYPITAEILLAFGKHNKEKPNFADLYEYYLNFDYYKDEFKGFLLTQPQTEEFTKAIHEIDTFTMRHICNRLYDDILMLLK